MAFSDSWHKALVYFGLAEERTYVDDPPDEPEPEAQLEDRYRERPNVRRLTGARRRRDEIDDIFADDDGPSRNTAVLRPVGGSRSASRSNGSSDVSVHLVHP